MGSVGRGTLRPDGEVIYGMCHPWPRAAGATHLLLAPHDFLRPLTALVSFPYSHKVRSHGVFAARSRFRRRRRHRERRWEHRP